MPIHAATIREIYDKLACHMLINPYSQNGNKQAQLSQCKSKSHKLEFRYGLEVD